MTILLLLLMTFNFSSCYDDKVIVQGITGIKDNQPQYFSEVMNKLENAIGNISTCPEIRSN
jgi:hypothetical protein